MEHCGLPNAVNAAEHRRACERGRLLCRTSAGVTVRARPLLVDRSNDSAERSITRHMRSLFFGEQDTVQTAMVCHGPVPRNCPTTACSCPCVAVPRVITSYATTMAYVQELLTAVNVIVPDDNGDDDGGGDGSGDGGDGGDCNEHAATPCPGNDGNRSTDLSRPQCAKRILLIGLGGGLFPLMYRRFCPFGTITTVEIDPSVVEMAVNMFGYQHHEGEQSRGRLIVGDGSAVLRAFALAEATERKTKTTTMTTTMPSVARFDAVIIDCFSASPRGSDGTGNVNIIPEGCRSRELYTNAHAVLRSGGKLVQNVIVRGEKKRGVPATGGGGGGGTSEEVSGGLHNTELTAILDLYRDIFGDTAVRSHINSSTVDHTSNNVVVVGVKGDT